MAHLSRVKRLAYDAGWMRWGWPERVGGLGGSALLRAYLGEALTARGFVEPGMYSMTEVLAPTMIDFAPPELAAEMVPRLLRGDETWCQGFSEPSTGSNLGALACRADRAPTTAGSSTGRRSGRASPSTPSAACCLCAPARPSRPTAGITALFVDMDTPGITVRPLEAMHGVLEFSEVFYDDVLVPFDRTLGDEGQGWAVAMDLLPYERSTALWHRGALLHRRLDQVLAAAEPGAVTPARWARRSSTSTPSGPARWPRSAGCTPATQLGPETSIDKILIATAEQAVFDLAADGLADVVALGDDRRGSAGGRSTSTRGRPRSTAAAPRSSATSSPAGCSTSDRPMMDAEERALFAKGVQDAVAGSTRRGPRRRAAALGWADALALDDARRRWSVLFEAQGRAGATRGARPRARARPRRATADRVVLPPFGRTEPPGRSPAGVTCRGPRHGARRCAGRCSSSPTATAVRSPRSMALDAAIGRGLDPALGLVEVTGTLRPSTTAPPAHWDDAVAAGQRAVAHELVGARRGDARPRPRARARAHPVRRAHRLVPGRAPPAGRQPRRVESADAAARRGVGGRLPFDAAVAKAIAGRGARLVAEHGQQVLAGIGFTTEHPLHRYVRRVRVLDGLLGDTRTLTRELGDQLLRDRGLPAILPL